ncbi:hypothetical protein [Gottschalkia acidurici]|uniref:hypothetical protein n=1 Tax=Clostridium acidurici TaxID=1556 RepID=UPI0005A1522C|nr:hypothetical protein [Gottschalkia acidurici]
MIKRQLESHIGEIDLKTLKLISDMATADIMFNRFNFGKKTSLDITIDLLIKCYNVYVRCQLY